MPSQPKSPRKRNPKPVRRSKETILGLLSQIAAARAAGSTLASALQQANVHYNNYARWVKRFGRQLSEKPAKKDGAKRAGKTEEEIRTLLEKVASVRREGISIARALREMGVSPSNYAYWRKKYGAEMAAVGAAANRAMDVVRSFTSKASAAAAPTGSAILELLEEMTENRKKRQELEDTEKRIQVLDARFEELRKRLGA